MVLISSKLIYGFRMKHVLANKALSQGFGTIKDKDLESSGNSSLNRLIYLVPLIRRQVRVLDLFYLM